MLQSTSTKGRKTALSPVAAAIAADDQLSDYQSQETKIVRFKADEDDDTCILAQTAEHQQESSESKFMEIQEEEKTPLPKTKFKPYSKRGSLGASVLKPKLQQNSLPSKLPLSRNMKSRISDLQSVYGSQVSEKKEVKKVPRRGQSTTKVDYKPSLASPPRFNRNTALSPKLR